MSVFTTIIQAVAKILDTVFEAVYTVGYFVFKCLIYVILLPIKLLKLIGLIIFTVIKGIWNGICDICWWFKHQVGLTSLPAIQAAGVKPVSSAAWELYDDFCPRYKLSYWLGNTLNTVEVRKWSYNPKKFTLTYTESNGLRSNTVHAPCGIPHTVSKIFWWEPVVLSTSLPSTPLHSN